VERFRMRLLK